MKTTIITLINTDIYTDINNVLFGVFMKPFIHISAIYVADFVFILFYIYQDHCQIQVFVKVYIVENK